jgi:C4-dicarboxylate transporter DctM subunit
MILLMALNVPVGFALGAATLGGILVIGDLPLMVLAQRMFSGMDSFTLIAIPLFILAGELMSLGGVTRDLMKFSMVFVGHVRGGLAYVNVVSSMIFAGITGSAATDTSSVGSVLIPTMINKGYDRDYTVALTATASTIGIVIPPSIPMVLYGVASNTSIGALFAGGVVPGFMIGFGLMAVAGWQAKKRGYAREAKKPLGENLLILLRGIPALMTVVIILGGIISGMFTPTEAAGVAVVYTFFLGKYYYKEVDYKDIPRILKSVGGTMGMVALMISAASALGWMLTVQGIPRAIGQMIFAATDNKVVILLFLNMLMLFVGTWMDITPAMIIFTPILLPIAMAVGVDPVHFGIILVVNLAIGLFTPPVGLCLFIACGIGEVTMTSVLKAVIPFFLVMLAVLMLVTYVPDLVMFLPNAVK